MSACEKFREYLLVLREEDREESVGEILHVFDDLHQYHRENTGEKCAGQKPEFLCPVCEGTGERDGSKFFAPDDDACTHCCHCNRPLVQHVREFLLCPVGQ